MNRFLFELGTEEIPARMISPALEQLGQAFVQILAEAGIPAPTVRLYNSPRRLAVRLDQMPDRQPDREQLVLGPPASIAFDENGNPTKAAEGFARKMRVEPSQLEKIETDKGAYLGFRQEVEGQLVKDILVAAIPGAIGSVYWPKNMYWRESRYRFIRPLRWLVVLWNDEVLGLEFEGLSSGRETRGHRFFGESEIALLGPEEYASRLRESFVLVDVEERRRRIREQLNAAVPEGAQILEDADLLETVSYLNEYPSAIAGSFDPKFLEIPREVLITVMRHHQKYFAIIDSEGRLLPSFLTVIENRGDPTGEIRKGHERVLKARLEDGAFFWANDQKKPLQERLVSLEQVLFQKELGSYRDKTDRVAALCAKLSQDPDLFTAATLCKTDLTTEMVFEMPELQGVMGGLYARQQGMPEGVWKAIYDHYRPESMDDSLPSTRNGALLSLADKLDTIVGCFRIGIVPSGSSDPFALRRQAQALIRILLEYEFDFEMDSLVEMADQSGDEPDRSTDYRIQLEKFLNDRIRFILREKGIPYDVLNAVMAAGVSRVHDVFKRASALNEIRRETDFEALAVGFKRVKNILTNQEFERRDVAEGDLEEDSEKALYQAFRGLREEFLSNLSSGEFGAALRQIAGLRGVVDRFFDDVLVICPDRRLRENRLRLLDSIASLFLQIADISEIVAPDNNMR